MKKILVGVALIGSAVSAQAADLAVKAPYLKAPIAAVYDWTGFYIGANVGVGLGRDLQTHAVPAGGVASHLSPQGVIGGGQIGYNWQSNTTFLGPLLIGVEADIQGSGMTDGHTTLSSPLGAANYNQKLDWFTTVRGRVGLVRGPVVGYFTGGFAAANVKTTVTQIGGIVPFAFSETRTGWTIGSGVEAAIGGNWTGKIEYLYLDLGNRNDVFGTQALRTEYRESIFRVGLNYRIGGNGMYITPPPANWAGLYLGGNFGGATARNRTTSSVIFSENFNLSPDGFVGGGQIGYNWQASNWVFGAEADFQGSTQKDDRAAVLSSLLLYNQKLPWFGTARARLGYTVGSTLFYATGGYAYGNVKTNVVTAFSNETFNRSRSGYAVGAGVETPFQLFGLLGPNWTSKTEYLYVDLGSTTDSFLGGAAVSTSKVTNHMLRTGINYHFNQPVVAKY
ncbi:outer membrane protein [Rhodopseudomonas palustris HaA2]|uniref:Outer membrane protein n=1 Tax=Rhodopseudomonas palustris (strain HaA2) TaxID=316058 RepID=Q2IR62_RHOP2|nr:outer membrane beta-barrel protein [Rhodopseudomonas palustris]ABD09298.1 outer membrane protein [Rhodopseudomonas palustris HaA2]